MKDHLKWLRTLAGRESGRQIAARSDLPSATVNRQIGRGFFAPEIIIGIARGYGQSPLEALAATGYLTPNEVTGVSPDAAAQLLTDQQLIRELARRIDADESAWLGTFGEVLQSAQRDADVVEFPRHEWVADSSEEELFPGDDGYGEGP